MEYIFETKLRGDGGRVLNMIGFDTDYPPDPAYPSLIFILARGVKYKRNKISLNGNFIGYLSSTSDVTMLEVDNTVSGGLMHQGNQISITPCDFWGNSDPESWLNLDNFEINVVQVAYSRNVSTPESSLVECPLINEFKSNGRM